MLPQHTTSRAVDNPQKLPAAAVSDLSGSFSKIGIGVVLHGASQFK
jgi:hypothetical protein